MLLLLLLLLLDSATSAGSAVAVVFGEHLGNEPLENDICSVW